MPRPRYPGLTPREQEVYDLLLHGLTNRQIAERMGISLDGAKYHVSQILMKLDVSTREEAVALTTRQRAFGFASVSVLLRKLSLGGVMKTTTVAVVSGAVVLLALIAVGVFIADTRSDDEEPASATGALPLTLGGQPSTFLALLEHIPASADSSLYFSDYAALRDYLGIQAPSQDAGIGEMTSYWSSLAEAGMFQNPLSDSFATGAAELNLQLGLNMANLDESLHFSGSENPCGPHTVLYGRFDEARIENALRQTSSFRDALTNVIYNGMPYFSWYEGCNRLTSTRGPGRLVLQDDRVFWSGESTTALEAMIDASHGATPSLASAQAYQLMAQAFADMNVFTSYAEVHSDPLWFEPLRELAEGEYGRNGPNVVAE